MFSFLKFFKKRKSHDVIKLLNSGDLFFDIGAHLGDKSKQFLRKNLEIIMVEPLPECIKHLKIKFSESENIKIIQKAVGQNSGVTTLEINSKNPTTSTMAEHWKSGRFLKEKWDHKITVEMTTLDELIKIYGIPDYIKIDVEGFELDVLLGLTQKVGIISFEFTSEFLDQAISCLNHLKKIKYSEYNFSIGERRKFFSGWTSIDDLIRKLKKEIQNDKLLWGDIYCR
tara:strand:- start:3617 stop:4297 length:681 start_codon:yes stop_codon:yes gene_type:complete